MERGNRVMEIMDTLEDLSDQNLLSILFSMCHGICDTVCDMLAQLLIF